MSDQSSEQCEDVMRKLIGSRKLWEINHPVVGLIHFSSQICVYDNHDGEKFQTIRFFDRYDRPVGEWDKEMGGNLNGFFVCEDPLSECEDSYLILERMIYDLMVVEYPTFFSPGHISWMKERKERDKDTLDRVVNEVPRLIKVLKDDSIVEDVEQQDETSVVFRTTLPVREDDEGYQEWVDRVTEQGYTNIDYGGLEDETIEYVTKSGRTITMNDCEGYENEGMIVKG